MAERTYIVMKTLRLTPKEAKDLQEKAKNAGMKEAEYIRFLLSQKPDDYPEIRILLKDLINEVNYIGKNINQIVRSHNAGFFRETDKRQLYAYMKKLNMAVEQVVHSLGNQ